MRVGIRKQNTGYRRNKYRFIIDSVGAEYIQLDLQYKVKTINN
jgi:hypothetical protein